MAISLKIRNPRWMEEWKDKRTSPKLKCWDGSTWRFPARHGGSLSHHHPFFMGFSMINHPAMEVSPCSELVSPWNTLKCFHWRVSGPSKSAVWQVPVAQDEAKKQEATKSDLICLKIDMEVSWSFLNYGYPGYPQIIHSNGSFHDQPSILGYPHLWKPPYVYIYIYMIQ